MAIRLDGVFGAAEDRARVNPRDDDAVRERVQWMVHHHVRELARASIAEAGVSGLFGRVSKWCQGAEEAKHLYLQILDPQFAGYSEERVELAKGFLHEHLQVAYRHLLEAHGEELELLNETELFEATTNVNVQYLLLSEGGEFEQVDRDEVLQRLLSGEWTEDPFKNSLQKASRRILRTQSEEVKEQLPRSMRELIRSYEVSPLAEHCGADVVMTNLQRVRGATPTPVDSPMDSPSVSAKPLRDGFLASPVVRAIQVADWFYRKKEGR